MTDRAEPGHGRRVGLRGRRQVVVVAAGLGAALLASTPAVWVRSATWTPLSERAEVTVTGVQAAPAVSAAGLLIVASALALAMARRWGAVLAGVVVVGGAGVAVAAVLSVLADPAVPAMAAARESVGVGLLDGAATVSPAPWVALALALVTAVVGCLAVLTSRAWAVPSARHEPVTGVPGPPGADDPAAWDALSRGQDPT